MLCFSTFFSKRILLTFGVFFVLLGAGALNSPLAKAGNAVVLICPDANGMPQNGNLPNSNANNTSFAGVSQGIVQMGIQDWSVAGSSAWSNARYPGVRLGTDAWDQNNYMLAPGTGVGQKLGVGTASNNYAVLKNDCGGAGGSSTTGYLEGYIKQNTYTPVPSQRGGDRQGKIARISLRVSAPRGFVGTNNFGGSNAVGFERIMIGAPTAGTGGLLGQGISANITDPPTNPPAASGQGWQARSVAFNPSSNPFEGDKILMGCMNYSVTDSCVGGNVVPSARWNNVHGPLWDWNPQAVEQTVGTQVAIWQRGVIPNTSANTGALNKLRTDYIADVFCNVQGINNCYAPPSASANNPYGFNSVRFKNFFGTIVDNEAPTTNLGNNQPVLGVSSVGGQSQHAWINKRPNETKILAFQAMDAGLGIASATASINNVNLPPTNWNDQCTNWGNYNGRGGYNGTVQYRLDRSFVVPRTGPGSDSAEFPFNSSNPSPTGGAAVVPQYTINRPPVCASSRLYATGVNLSNGAMFSEGANVFSTTIRDYTRPDAPGTENVTTENKTIRIDTVAPNVNFAVIASDAGGRCYSPAANNGLETNCLTIENSIANNQPRYIKGGVNFAVGGNDPRGQLPNASSNDSHSGLAWAGTNIFRVNGNLVHQCAAPIQVPTYNYNTSLYSACPQVFNTANYGNGSTVQFQSNIPDNAANTGWTATQPFIIDNVPPNNHTRAIGDNVVFLAASDPANGSGLRNNQVEYLIQVAQPSAAATGSFAASGTTLNLGAGNNRIWTRTEDNIGNRSAWRLLDLSRPDTEVVCEESSKVNIDWFGSVGEIPCWIEASGRDGQTPRINNTEYRYENPANATATNWALSQTQNFIDGNESIVNNPPAYQLVQSEGVDMTLVQHVISNSNSYKGTRYQRIARPSVAWNPARANWLNSWGAPKNIASMPSNYFQATGGGGVKPSNEHLTLNSSSDLEYMFTAKVKKSIGSPPASSLNLVGNAIKLSGAAAAPAVVSTTNEETAAVSGSSNWQNLRSRLNIPNLGSGSASYLLTPPSLQLSAAPTSNPDVESELALIDYSLISKVFRIPLGLQGKTKLQAKSTNINAIESLVSEKEINRDATPPDLNGISIAPSVNSNPNGVNTAGKIENGKYSGFVRLRINAQDRFVGDPEYDPENSQIQNKAQAQMYRNLYAAIPSAQRTAWAPVASGMASGAWVACSVEANSCTLPPADVLNENSPWFVIQQDNPLIPDLCRGTTFSAVENGNYSCIFDTRLLPFREGEFILRFRAEDAAGNISYSEARSVDISRQVCVIPGFVAAP